MTQKGCLQLVDHGFDLCNLHERLQMMGHEVADTDRFDPAGFVQLLKCFPGAGIEFLPVMLMVVRNGPVDQVQIQILQAQIFHGFLKSGQGGLITLLSIPQLAGDEQLLTGNAALFDRLSYADLVAVNSSGVDVAIANFHSGFDGLADLVIGGQEGAETDAGDFNPVIEHIAVCQTFHIHCFFAPFSINLY